MSKADKMFIELGYEKYDEQKPKNRNLIYYRKQHKHTNNITSTIVFDLDYNIYHKYLNHDYYLVEFNKNEHLAIHQKMKELGWLDE